jgi:hypothetical protein
MLIAILNQSTLVKDADVITMTAAIQTQINLHYAPAWNEKPTPIKFFTNKNDIPGYAWVIYLMDTDASVPGALGFHQQENNGKIDGFILCQPILSNNGAVLAFDANNSSQYTVSATLSHEVLETLQNRFVNKWFDNGATTWAGEICDPIEQVSYGIAVDGASVSVSDFCFPNFFNSDATEPVNGPFNYLKSLKAPFSMASGGYSLQRTAGPGTETQVFGATMPQWRRSMKMKEFARGGRIGNPLSKMAAQDTSKSPVK